MRSLLDVLHLTRLTIFTVFPPNSYYLCYIVLLSVGNTAYLNVPFPCNDCLWSLRTVWLPQPIVSAGCACLPISTLKPVLFRKWFVSPLSCHSSMLIFIIGIPTMLRSWSTYDYVPNLCNTASTTYRMDDIDLILLVVVVVVVVQPLFTASVSVCLPSHPII